MSDGLNMMQKRFHELTEKVNKIREETAPLREERDRLVNANVERIQELERMYKALEAPLFDMEQERAALARALKGKTGII